MSKERALELIGMIEGISGDLDLLTKQMRENADTIEKITGELDMIMSDGTDEVDEIEENEELPE